MCRPFGAENGLGAYELEHQGLKPRSVIGFAFAAPIDKLRAGSEGPPFHGAAHIFVLQALRRSSPRQLT